MKTGSDGGRSDRKDIFYHPIWDKIRKIKSIKSWISRIQKWRQKMASNFLTKFVNSKIWTFHQNRLWRVFFLSDIEKNPIITRGSLRSTIGLPFECTIKKTIDYRDNCSFLSFLNTLHLILNKNFNRHIIILKLYLKSRYYCFVFFKLNWKVISNILNIKS